MRNLRQEIRRIIKEEMSRSKSSLREGIGSFEEFSVDVLSDSGDPDELMIWLDEDGVLLRMYAYSDSEFINESPWNKMKWKPMRMGSGWVETDARNVKYLTNTFMKIETDEDTNDQVVAFIRRYNLKMARIY